MKKNEGIKKGDNLIESSRLGLFLSCEDVACIANYSG